MITLKKNNNDYDIKKIFKHPMINNTAYNPPLKEGGLTRLYMNENLFGPTPKIIEALKDLKPNYLYMYGFGCEKDAILMECLSQFLGLCENNIILNNGEASVIQQIIVSVIDKDDLLYMPQYGWPYYESTAMLCGGVVKKFNICCNNHQFWYDSCSIICDIGIQNPKIIVLVSPNMPTGNSISAQNDIELLAKKYEKTLIIVDEAYFGFSYDYNIDIGHMISNYPNVIFLRTFSKFYALAGLRVGYAICNESLNSILKKSSPLFGIGTLQQIACKIAIEDKSYYNTMRDQFNNVKNYFIEEVNKIENFYAFLSDGNFVLIKVNNFNAEKIIVFLKLNGYLIRECSSYGLINYIRISIGTRENMENILKLLIEFAARAEKN